MVLGSRFLQWKAKKTTHPIFQCQQQNSDSTRLEVTQSSWVDFEIFSFGTTHSLSLILWLASSHSPHTRTHMHAHPHSSTHMHPHTHTHARTFKKVISHGKFEQRRAEGNQIFFSSAA